MSMPHSPIRGYKGQVLIDGEKVGACNWSGVTSKLDVRPKRDDAVPATSFGLPTEFTVTGTYQTGDWADVGKVFGLTQGNTARVIFKGRRWFHPTLTFDKAWFINLEPELMIDTLRVDLSMVAPMCEVEYPNFWARPVFWLWRIWTKFTKFVRDWRGFYSREKDR